MTTLRDATVGQETITGLSPVSLDPGSLTGQLRAVTTLSDHAGDKLAESMLPVADALAAAVLAGDVSAVAAILQPLDWHHLAALNVVQARLRCPVHLCESCGRVRQKRRSRTGLEGSLGLCGPCYRSSRSPAMTPVQEMRQAWTRVRDGGATIGEARAQLWVTERTATRYERVYQQRREQAA